MNSPRAILFDFSGTLVDDLKTTVVAANHAIRKIAKNANELTVDQFVEKFHMPYWDFFQELGVSPEEAHQRAPALFQEAYLKGLDSIALFQDVKEVLVQMRKRDFQTGIVSSTPRTIIEMILRKHHSSNLFDVVLGLEDCNELKPSGKPLLQAVQRLGRSPSEVAYVGDMDEDVQAADAAGIVPIAIWRERGHYQELDVLTSSNPPFLVHRLTEILLINWREGRIEI